MGPLLAARVSALGLASVTVHSDFQLQVEHALDLPDDGLALFIDAHCSQRVAVSFSTIEPASECPPGTHALSPEQVLGVAQRIGRPVPPSWLLSLRGREFELGAPLSPSGRLVLGAGWGLLRSLLAVPALARWQGLAAAGSPGCRAGSSPGRGT